jgi:hypothetical protein
VGFWFGSVPGAGEAKGYLTRPTRLVNKPLTGKYRTVVGANVPRGYAISCGDVAHLMLAALDNPATARQKIGIAY